MSKKLKFSPQQLAFFDWAQNGTGSCVLEAVAGAGKSTVLINSIKRFNGNVALLAYNKKIADELSEKLKQAGIDWKKAEAGTVHSFGFRALRKQFQNIKVDGNKVLIMLDAQYNEAHPMFVWKKTISKLVSMAKQRALGVVESIDDTAQWIDIAEHYDIFNGPDQNEPEPPKAEIYEAAKLALKASNRRVDVVDFDDMVYLPLVHRCRFWQYDVVMVDEAQDTNPARRALVRALVKRGGRVVAVGDRHQAIYGFTGADNDSLELIKQDFNAIEMPLTVTFRCPKAVVAFSQQWVNHIQAADEAPDGSVSQIAVTEFFKRNDLNGDAAVLCRNTKPLVELAFACIRNKIACKVEGRDIGKNIQQMITRWKGVKTLNQLVDKLDSYFEKQKTRLLAQKKEVKLQQLEDMVETIKVIVDQCLREGKHTIADAAAYVETLFADDVKGIMVLSTIHKSKGREWQRVFWLDRTGTCPSRWARQQWQQEQEINLMYVAATRAKQDLIEVLV